MRLLTRSDFDGLACAVFLKEAGVIDEIKFVHPKDIQDGLVTADYNDCLANIPYIPGCGLWFDHHSSEAERLSLEGKFKGSSDIDSPSAAHVIYDYYGGRERFRLFEDLLLAVDKVDSGKLTKEEVLDPRGWVLLGFIMDPRTGLGRFHDFKISNYQLMEKMIEWCRTKTLDEILAYDDVQERIHMYFKQEKLFREMVSAHTHTVDDIIITDLRGVDPIYTGNRFMIYSLYPNQNISVWIVSGRGGKGCSCAVGHSILNRTSKVNVGELMLKYGGGGHRVVGTCQFDDEVMEQNIKLLTDDIVKLNK